MIITFKCKLTEKLFNDNFVKKFVNIERAARRKLLIVHRAKYIGDLNLPPGNRLEQLKGNRKEQFSIRVNDQWRICFIWQDGLVYDVEIVDYH